MRHREARGISWAMAPLLAVVLLLAGPLPAFARNATVSRPTAPTTLFSSSFEAGDQQPTWTNTVETDATGSKRAAGIDGASSTGIPGSVMGKVVEVTASGEYTDAGEVKENVVDGDVNSKWLTFTPTAWVQVKLAEPVAVVDYAVSSANDAPERDPRDWTLQGSADGQTWSTLDTQTGQAFSARFQTKEYRFSNATPYLYYRFDITHNVSGGTIQLAELQLSNGDTTPPPASDMKSLIGKGPASSPTAKTSVGYTGLKAFQFSGRHLLAGRAYSYNKVFDVNVPVTADTELSYLIFPELSPDDPRNPATYAAVDLAFSDGTYLSELGAKDQNGAVLSPQGQGASKTLYTMQWNARRSTIGAVAAGKTIKRILVAYDGSSGPTVFRDWVDDIHLTSGSAGPAPSSPAQHVLTTRGTNSTGGFSRGNNVPATAVPQGFNFWVPMTNAGSTSWLYEYQRANNTDNRPTLQAFAASHEPSPWMGDRQTFQVMPSAMTGTPSGGRGARALPFGHENETAQPHYYSVTFDNGIRTEIAPTDHAAMFRFTFASTTSNVIFDNVNNASGLTIDPSGVVTGYSDVRSGLSTGATRMFVYATLDHPIVASGMLPEGNRVSTGYAQFDTTTSKVVTMRIATSLISTEQARRNLEQEIAPADTLESVRARAQRLWDQKLGIVQVEGASEDQLRTLYSNLYRLYLFPNSAYENTGTTASPVYRHAVQASTTSPPVTANTPTQTGAQVADGKVYVNNGFWDTYRTTWPAYSLLTPTLAGQLADGFVQQYKDGGWIPRWSAPGYADLMVGTSSDVAFADAYLKGVSNFDVSAAYDAALKNATVVAPNNNVGRKGFAQSPFLGYTPMESTGEAMSWAMDGYINDFGIANLAKARLASAAPDDPARQRYTDEYNYFLNRAQNYVNMFDPSVGFFQGRDATGKFRLPAGQFDPRVWGGDYTETDAWNMAFHVPQDGRGLANLYGGPDKLATKLDEFFATPETAMFPGSYGGTIHEMTEARDVRMGQYGHSNQPSHHIIYMYDYAGQPWKTQAKVREATSRLYLGAEIGQGYAGDEDNGEMSAWQIFSALGFYPLQMGSPYYAIGSPLFKKATVNLENGKKIVVNAPNNSQANVYVQRLSVNGRSYDKTYLPHEILANGAVLDFTMGPAPSTWGTGAADAPLSITKDGDVPRPLRDVTGAGNGVATASDGTDLTGLFDNTSDTRVTFAGPNPSVQYQFTGDREKVTSYTLTSGAVAGDPSGWVLKGSYDGKTWTDIDTRAAETFPWRLQTRPFTIAKPGRYAYYRLDVRQTSGAATTGLAELELLAKAEPPCTATVSGRHAGALTVSSGVTCLAAGATVTGPVTVGPGASLRATDASIGGPLSAAGARSVVLLHTTVAGPAILTATGELSLEDSTISGAVLLVANGSAADGPALVAADQIRGPLSCVLNNPAPVNNGLPNAVGGPKVGQCATM
jgi:predicted alpha-1,2-mannosidase